MIRFATLAFPIVLLAGCGSAGSGNNSASDSFTEGFMNGFRKNFVSQCVEGAQKTSGTTRDFTTLCSCVADKVMAGKTTTQLMSPPSDEETRQVAAQCQRDHPAG
jgi:hypothetical protein